MKKESNASLSHQLFKILPLMSLFGIQLSFAQIQEISNIPKDGKNYIDWGSRTVVATGIGIPNPNMPASAARPMAIQAARNIALRNALELIKGVTINSQTTIENAMMSNDVIKTSINGYIRSFKESEPKYFSDKTIEVRVSVPLDNQLEESVLPKELDNTPEKLPTPTIDFPHSDWSGLIIDARGITLTPALSPRIIDEAGREVYDVEYVSRDAAIKWGLSAYSRSIDQAKGLKDRIGERPGMIKAISSSGTLKTDVIISKKDAEKILTETLNKTFLQEARVVILVD